MSTLTLREQHTAQLEIVAQTASEYRQISGQLPMFQSDEHRAAVERALRAYNAALETLHTLEMQLKKVSE